MNAAFLAKSLRDSRGFAHKADIAGTLAQLGIAGSTTIAVGDDCAAIPDGDGFLLLAIEGFIDSFVASDPAFAGYCGVMVNLSDIAAMGGRPIAVVDAVWSRDATLAQPIFDGLAQAAAAYSVPVVGGHSNLRAAGEHLAVAVLGRAQRLLSSFAARPGDVLLAAIDLRGRYREPAAYWDASSAATQAGLGARLRGDLELLPHLAEAGLCDAAKDISMAGVIGTAVMFAEASGVAMSIDPDAIPRPDGADLLRWLGSFPSFGFLLASRPAHAPAIAAMFTERDIACASIGTCTEGKSVSLTWRGETHIVWDLAQGPFIGCRNAA